MKRAALLIGTSSIGYGCSALDDDFAQGYRDGRNIDSPEPSGNRSPAYRHSFEVGRAELTGKPIPAHISRAKAAKIKQEMLNG